LNLDRLFRPASVAVVGATDRLGSYGGQTLLNLRAIGYPGRVWGVNPNRAEALGHPCYPTIAELPEVPDAVVVAVPAPGVPDVIEQAGAHGCGGAVVYGAGFAEAAAGVELQRELIAAARRHDLPVCGPNCDGIVAMHSRAALWGDALDPTEPGAVALVSQSGNLAVNALATRRGMRFHTVIASGNQAVLSAADYLEFLAHEDGVRAVALYLEADGSGPDLCDGLAACASAGIPVVVLKVGTSSAGARAAAAHSAALAGDQRVFRALVEEAGAIWAPDVHDLLELAKTLATRRPGGPSKDGAAPRGGLAIMTCSGGDSAQAADEAPLLGMELAELSPKTQRRLAELLPPQATVANPLDYTALIWGERDQLREIVRALGEDPSVGQVLVFYDQPYGLTGAPEESWRAVREAVIEGAAVSPAPVMVSSTLPELLDDSSALTFALAGVPAAAGLRTGMRCAAAARTASGDPVRLREIAATARAATAGQLAEDAWLAEHEAKELLRGAGVNVIDGRVLTGEDDAVRALDELGGRIAMKLSAAALRHKSELGAVILDLDTEADVRSAFRRLAERADAHGGAVLGERMASGGIELIVAAHTDGIVPALVIGLGGIWTELLEDVRVVPLPAHANRIEQELRMLRGAPLLLRARGTRPVDLGAVARLAERVGELLIADSLELIECNPVLAGPDHAVALDASIRRGAAVKTLDQALTQEQASCPM
jgi:acyl-CoA synthetase (NDP forming)